VISHKQTRQQAWWALELLGTVLTGFSVAGLVAIAMTAGGWREALVPGVVAAVAGLACWALVHTRPRRWRGVRF